MRVPRLLPIVCCAAFSACDKKSPPAAPSVDPPGAVVTINGSERIGWDQRATDVAELATIRYALYSDNTRSELANASCASAAVNGAFECSARLPALGTGTHTLELASFVVDGSVLESSRSTALRVNITAATPAVSIASPYNTIVTWGTSARFRLELVAGDVERPTDIAFAPDGRIFVAERRGRIRVIPGSAETVGSGARLVALALDPQFEQTHFVYTITASAAPSGETTFVLARLREVSNTFGDRAVLMDGVRAAAPDPSVALRFGPDGALYVAFDDGGDARAAEDLASAQGKVLRLNQDGTTPPDQAGASPLFAPGFHSPAGIAWSPRSDLLWVAERSGALSAIESTGAASDRRKRGVTRQRHSLPAETPPSSIAFFENDMLVATGDARHLLRVRFDEKNPATIVGTERLLQDRIGPIHVVATAPDGAIYIGTDTAIARLVPAGR